MRPAPSIAAGLPDDIDVYLVLDDFGGRLGRAWRETGEERTDRETLITDLLEGQYNAPARIVAFNTAEGWSLDVSEDLTDEIADRLAIEGRETVPTLQDFLERHGSGKPVQLPLPLRSVA